MAEIADFSSSPPGPPWQALVRPLTPADVPVVAGLHAAREGVAVSRAEQVVRGWCSETTRHVLVAEVEGRVRGFASCALGRLDESASPSEGRDPVWFLAGVVVDPAARRHGLGRQLTTARLDLLADLTDEVWCVVNARNRPSLDLHADLGFVEHCRGPRLAGVEFTGGLGLLLRRVL